MVPHISYFPESHGRYYFRPYNYTQVAAQQKFVEGIGGNPQSPYADGLFERVYQEVEGGQ